MSRLAKEIAAAIVALQNSDGESSTKAQDLGILIERALWAYNVLNGAFNKLDGISAHIFRADRSAAAELRQDLTKMRHIVDKLDKTLSKMADY